MSSAKTTKQINAEKSSDDVFGKKNYLLLGAGIFILILGYALMAMDTFIDATKFSVSLYISPVVIIIGYVEIVFAILYRPKKQA